VKQDEQAGRIRGRERFGRAQRVRSPRDFQRVRRLGRSVSGRLLTLGFAPCEQREAPTRAGFSASKRVGGAVVRNRLKRRLREALRRLLPALAPGWDLVLTARAAAAEASYEALASEVQALLTRAGLWNAGAVEASRPMQKHGDIHADERGGT
jgi:ribonuclease P protein component